MCFPSVCRFRCCWRLRRHFSPPISKALRRPGAQPASLWGQVRLVRTGIWSGIDRSLSGQVFGLIMFIPSCCFQVPVCSGGVQTSHSLMMKYKLLFLPLHPYLPPLPPPATPPPVMTCLLSNLLVKLRMMMSQVRWLPVPPPGGTGETIGSIMADLEIPWFCFFSTSQYEPFILPSC